MTQDDELNKMFREGLSEPGHHAEYREADWDALEKMLDKREKKRGIILWWPIASGIAAMLLLFLGWMFFKSPGTEKVKPTVAVNKTTPANRTGNSTSQQQTEVKQPVTASTGETMASATKPVDQDKTNDITRPKPNLNWAGKAKYKQKPASLQVVNGDYLAANRHRRKGNAIVNNNHVTPKPSKTGTVIAAAKPDKIITGTEIAGNNAEKNNAGTMLNADVHTGNPEVATAAEKVDTIAGAKVKTGIAEASKNKIKNTASGVHLALTVLAASNINGVSSFQQSQVGAGAGLLFTAGVGRFTLSTGAIYAKAPYETEYSNYHIRYQFATNPEYVNADCRILDILVNVGYRLYANVKNKFSVGAGLSSYLMLKENYVYTYADPATVGPTGYEISNRNKHYFGVLNLNALYQHRLNTKFSFDMQPYFKLPLTNIGYGKVKLQSAGLAVGLSWNIK